MRGVACGGSQQQFGVRGQFDGAGALTVIGDGGTAQFDVPIPSDRDLERRLQGTVATDDARAPGGRGHGVGIGAPPQGCKPADHTAPLSTSRSRT
ncbi:MAG TPA: hypothetical protein VNJ04_20780 [Gemmatimonadaceae bacterium]|nr:hypothetical protein [Gemmatimonadaceae bacterium]